MPKWGRGREQPPKAPLRVEEINEALASMDLVDLEEFLARDLTEEEGRWVINKAGGVPPQMTDGLREQMRNSGLSGEDIHALSPMKATYLVLGGPAAFQNEIRARESEEEPVSEQPEQTPREAKEELRERVAEVEAAGNRTLEQKKEDLENRTEEKEFLKETVDELDLDEVQLGIREQKNEIRSQKLAEEAGIGAERWAMRETEEAYLEAYKDFHANKRLYNIREPKKLKELKEKYDTARYEFAQRMDESMRKRYDERHDDNYTEASIKEQIAIREKAALTFGRYNRLVRFNEIIKPAAERKLRAREEALSSRERGVFRKALGQAVKANQSLEEKIGKNKARVARAAAAAVLVTGSSAALGAFGAAGLLTVAGYGTVRFSRSLFAAFAGAATGQAVGGFYEKYLGRAKLDRSREALKEAGRSGAEKVSLKDIQSFDQERERLIKNADERTLQRKKNLVKAFTALGIGAGSAAFLADWEQIDQFESPDDVTEPASQQDRQALGRDQEAEQVDAKRPVAQPESEAAGTQPVAPIEMTDTETPREPVIDSPGEGANSMFYELQAQIKHQPEAQRSELAQHILSDMTVEQWSETLGFFKVENGETISRIMHEGDRLSISPQGELIFHDAFRDKNYTLLNARGELQMDAIEEVKKGIPDTSSSSSIEQPMPIVTPEEVPDMKVEPTAPVMPDVSEAPVDTGGEAVRAAEAAQVAAERAEEAARTSSSSSEGVTTLGEMIASPQSGGEEAVNTEAAPRGGDAGVQTLGEFISPQEQAGDLPFVNAHGLEIDPTTTALYSWQIPGTDISFKVVYGGTEAEASAAAEQYARMHPNELVLYNSVDHDPFTGREIPVLRGWSSDSSGLVTNESNLPNPADNMRSTLGPASPQDFIRRVNQ